MKLDIVHLQFPNAYLMNASLLRFQAYHEDPKLRHRLFSLEEFMDTYAAAKGGAFTYFEDWWGCNFPGDIPEKFQSTHSKKESWVYSTLTSLSLKDYYVIATFEGAGKESLGHKIVHGLYHLNPAYAKAAQRLCRKHATALAPFRNHLTTLGYHRAVIADEINAYLTTNSLDVTCKIRKTSLPVKEFQNLFAKWFGFPPSRLKKEEWRNTHLHTVVMDPPKNLHSEKDWATDENRLNSCISWIKDQARLSLYEAHYREAGPDPNPDVVSLLRQTARDHLAYAAALQRVLRYVGINYWGPVSEELESLVISKEQSRVILGQ